jgi:hypothetical protein
MSETVTIIVSLVGGSTGGAVLGSGFGAWQAARLRGITRQGRARLVHEDLYRLQSTITRLFYETDEESQPGKQSWLIPALAGTEDQQDVVAHLRGADFKDCAGALGWSAYLRNSYDTDVIPSDEELTHIYERLSDGRRAVACLAKLGYEKHKPLRVVSTQQRKRNRQESLPLADYG